jgi:hypothetical protein
MRKREEIDSQLYLPRLLYLRLNRRERLKGVTITCMVYNFFLLIIGFVFVDCIWDTRSYLGVTGDEFWETHKVNETNDGEVQLISAFTGILTLVSSFYNIMNLSVILYHTHNGGLLIRLKFAQWVYLVLNIIIFGYSIIPIALYSITVILFPIYIALMSINLIICVIFIILSTKVTRKELEYMLPISLMKTHKDEYYQEYLTKKKALINLNHEVEENNKVSSDNENKIFIKN